MFVLLFITVKDHVLILAKIFGLYFVWFFSRTHLVTLLIAPHSSYSPPLFPLTPLSILKLFFSGNEFFWIIFVRTLQTKMNMRFKHLYQIILSLLKWLYRRLVPLHTYVCKSKNFVHSRRVLPPFINIVLEFLDGILSRLVCTTQICP
jgi:hypothetical protein